MVLLLVFMQLTRDLFAIAKFLLVLRVGSSSVRFNRFWSKYEFHKLFEFASLVRFPYCHVEKQQQHIVTNFALLMPFNEIYCIRPTCFIASEK